MAAKIAGHHPVPGAGPAGGVGIGKDYLGTTTVLGSMPSGSDWQVSLAGLLSIGIAREEGIEIQLLGLGIGLDFNDIALRLPGIGRVALFSEDHRIQQGSSSPSVATEGAEAAGLPRD